MSCFGAFLSLLNDIEKFFHGIVENGVVGSALNNILLNDLDFLLEIFFSCVEQFQKMLIFEIFVSKLPILYILFIQARDILLFLFHSISFYVYSPSYLINQIGYLVEFILAIRANSMRLQGPQPIFVNNFLFALSAFGTDVFVASFALMDSLKFADLGQDYRRLN